MNTRQNKKPTNKTAKFNLFGERVSDGNKKLDRLVGFLFLLGLVLLVWEIFIYRRTIIELKIPLLIWLTPGVFLTPLLYKKMNFIDGMKAHWTLHYILHTCMTGGVILFAFMASNFYFASNEIENKKFEIIGFGSLPGSKGHRSERKPYVMINYQGMEKQLIFSYLDTDKVNSSTKVNVAAKRGLWGFDILERYEVE
jgi:hypothetical protein